MSTKLSLIGGIPRTVPFVSSVYDERSQPGNVTAGNPVTLPNSGSYEGAELQIELNGQGLDFGIDWNTSGAGPTYTAVTFTFDIVSTDDVNWRIENS